MTPHDIESGINKTSDRKNILTLLAGYVILGIGAAEQSYGVQGVCKPDGNRQVLDVCRQCLPMSVVYSGFRRRQIS